MADTAVAITAGTGTSIDTRTEATNGNHRQVVVIGDPATNAGVAPVDATNGLAVQVIPALPTGTNNIGQVDPRGNVASGVTDSGNPIKIGGKYTTTAPTLSDGQRGDMQVDVNSNVKIREQYSPVAEDNIAGVIGNIFKPVNSSTYAPSTYKNAGTVTKANVKASPGNVYSIRITNANAAIRYFQLHNKASTPVAAETAQQYFLIPAGTATQPAVLELTINDFAPSEYFITGIGWAISTTAATFTDSATATDHIVNVRFV